MRCLSVVLLALVSVGCEQRPGQFTPADDSQESVTIRIDESVRYQVMQGFGGFGAKRVWWDQAPFYDQEFVDLLVNDLGITIHRDNIPLSLEPQNDNDDPFDLDLTAFNLTEESAEADGPLSDHLPYLKALQQAGVKKFVASIWSPPLWMKHNGQRGNGRTRERESSAPPFSANPDESTNQLRTEHYEEFAEYCVAYIKILKTETGIDLYAISLQNEPRFSQWYSSTVYSPSSLRDLVKVVGRRFSIEGITTKIFYPEDVYSMWHIRPFLESILEDTTANQYVDIFAIHNYASDGVNPADSGPENWRETLEYAKRGGKEVWMTETSGFDGDTIDGGIELAKSIYNALQYGHASAWIYWQMSSESKSALMHEGRELNHLYHVSKQFYRHIRPGFTRVQASSSHSDLLALAFDGGATSGMVVVLVNVGAQPLEVSLENNVRTFDGFISSQKRFHEPLATNLASTNGFQVPALSVVTLKEQP
jgi:O-glycosyl hydrolase